MKLFSNSDLDGIKRERFTKFGTRKGIGQFLWNTKFSFPIRTQKLILLFVSSFSLAFAQNPQPHFRNYTTEDGLPSPEVHHVLQDKEGNMWFATDNGVSRFDGYSFQNFGTNEGLPDNVVFNLQETDDGRIWINTMSGNLCFFEKGAIHAYQFNDRIQQEKRNCQWKEPISERFFIAKDNTVFVGLTDWGILKIDPKGNTKLFRGEEPTELVILEIENQFICEKIGHWFDVFRHPYFQKYSEDKFLQPIELHKEDTVIVFEGFYNDVQLGNSWIIKLADGNYLLNSNSYTYLIKNDEIAESWRSDAFLSNTKAYYRDEKGFIFQGFGRKKGLRIFENPESFNRRTAETHLNDHSVSSIFKDKAGGLWATSTDAGVFYCRDWDQKIYNSNIDLPDENVMSIAVKNDSVIFVGLRNGIITELNVRTNILFTMPRVDSDIFDGDLFYDAEEDILWAAHRALSYFKNGSWKKISKQTGQDIRNLVGKRLFHAPNKEFLWVAGRRGFGKVDKISKNTEYHSERQGLHGRTFAILESNTGRVWVGNTKGLFEFRDNQLIQPKPNHPAFQFRVEALGELSDNTLVVGTKGSGVILWKGDRFLQITTAQGLTENMIENIHVDSGDQIWAGTYLGLNKITFDSNGNPKIRLFTTKHGLPSNEINKVRTFGDKIWVATTKGLVNLVERPPSSFSRKPLLQYIKVNDELFFDSLETSVPFGKNKWVFQFLTINYRQHGNIPYRYRLLPGQVEWTNTHVRTVNFSALQDGIYTFEVQSQNEDGYWSPSTTFNFEIRPPFWKTGWFITLAILAVGGSIYARYWYRIRQIRRESEMVRKITELERSALRAQINPHFIFNALNSIQRLINSGDKISANRYLTKFAHLVRSAIDQSKVTKINLEDEIKMLENYLELEKMRFESGFDYRISVGEDIETFAVEILSMLIQPFVENAIIHGMTQKKEKGKIEIDFRREDKILLATITDNGIGIEQSLKKKGPDQSLQKSLGMMVTQRRLELLSGSENKHTLKVEELKGTEGEVLGTRVTLKIMMV